STARSSWPRGRSRGSTTSARQSGASGRRASRRARRPSAGPRRRWRRPWRCRSGSGTPSRRPAAAWWSSRRSSPGSVRLVAEGRGGLGTGASRGVGAATARAFAERGDRVVVHYRGAEDRAREVLGSLPGTGHAVLRADLSSPEETRTLAEDAIDALGRVDVLVNNAALFLDPAGGGSRRGDHRIVDVDYEQWVRAWQATLATNLVGPANLPWCIARHMIEVAPADGVPVGRIVNVGSRGAYRGEPDVPAYGASKAGLHAFG